jgi:glutamate---cysteine ligase / carboxylate-amine ligase
VPAPWALGVEEELMLVEAETFLPARDGWSRVFGEPTERIMPELFESFVEITTPVCETAEEVEAELRALRHEVGDRAAEHGLTVIAVGSHPTARDPVPIVPVERYERLKRKRGASLNRQVVAGLHVHVSVPEKVMLRAFEGTVPHLPALLAASANSPYFDGVASGWRSIRSQIILEMPRGGTPGLLRSWDDWEKNRLWDVRPRPDLGTLEVRVMDQPTSVRRTAELAAEVQRLVREAAEWTGEPFDRDAYARERERAGREGGGPEAERQLKLGPEAALAELVGLTLR